MKINEKRLWKIQRYWKRLDIQFERSSFLRQAFPEKHKAVLEAYKNATSDGCGYILFDFRCDTHDKERIRSNIFPDEINYVYQ